MNTDTKPRKQWKTPTLEILAVNGGGNQASIEAGKTDFNFQYYVSTVVHPNSAAKFVVQTEDYKFYMS